MADKLTKQDLLALAGEVLDIESRAVENLKTRLNDEFVAACQLCMETRGRVVVTGMGKSGAVGRKISSTFTSTGTTSYFLHPAEGMHGDLGLVHKDDVVIAISKSGETEEILQILPALGRLNVPIISMTGNKDSSLSRNSKVTLDISVQEEACPHDLAPTASTTLTMVMGDALAKAQNHQRKNPERQVAL